VVLAKPINSTFEISSKKINDFKNRDNKNGGKVLLLSRIKKYDKGDIIWER